MWRRFSRLLPRTCGTSPARVAPGQYVWDKGSWALSNNDGLGIGKLSSPMQGSHCGKTSCTAEHETTGHGIVLSTPQCQCQHSRLATFQLISGVCFRSSSCAGDQGKSDCQALSSTWQCMPLRYWPFGSSIILKNVIINELSLGLTEILLAFAWDLGTKFN